MIQIFILNGRLRTPLLLTCLVILLFNNVYNFYGLKIYGHIFTPDQTSTFVAIVDQVQVELELIPTNLEKINVSLAQNHAYKAVPLTSKIVSEIAEDNQRLAADLLRALNDLQNISSFSKTKQQDIKQLVSDLDERLDEAKIVRLAQVQPSSNFLDKATEFLRGIFGGNNGEVGSAQIQNSRIEALAFAELTDAVLRNYGKAYAVDFDMTNMSNMVMARSNGTARANPMIVGNPVTGNNIDTGSMNMNMNGKMNLSMHSMNTSAASVTKHDGEMNGHYSLVNIADYQSAQAEATKASEIFNTKLKLTTLSNNKNITAFVTNLEKGITQLNDAISKKASPMHVMMIVHTQIHPNLLEAFSLGLRK